MADHFLSDIQTYDKNQETGRLDIKNLNHPQQSWSLYLRLGRLFWLAGGKHEQRRIYRQLKNHNPQKFNHFLALFPEVASTSEATYYNFLAYLLQKEYLTMTEFLRIKQAIKLEVFFDLLQIYHIQSQASSDYGMSSGLQWEWSANVRPERYIPIPRETAQSTDSLVKQAQKSWQNWREAGLTYCWPNQAPVMTQPEQIQNVTAEKTFQNLKRLLTGQDSLRDIALATKRDLLPVTKALWGYYKKGWLQFQEIPDLNWNPLTQQNEAEKTTATATSKNPKFLIACVDDSPQVTQTVEQIVRENGYDFIGINDPLRANATLLKVKP
ncbi:MAG: response regulator, partial [Halothece sp. Uz-M2-17]|nr:response regulator [Halothece sp. Uz-M2-17]